MEALGTVASVAGILSLAVQGIQAIKSLHSLYEDCTDEAAREFLHELSTSSVLLQEVRSLCLDLERQKGAAQNQIRLKTLEIQVEDCTVDLEHWLTTAKRIDSRQWKLARATGTNSSKRQFATLLQRVLKAKAMIATSQARQLLRHRFGRHQQNVRTALALIQTEFHILQARRIEEIGMHLANSTNDSALHNWKQSQILSQLQSSGSSILAYSMSLDERLRDIQSLFSDLSDKLDQLNSAVSSQSSQISSRSDSHGNTIAITAYPILKRKSSNSMLLSHVDSGAKSVASDELPGHDDNELDASVDEELDAVINEEVLNNVNDDFHLIVKQYFDTIIAEYVLAARQWQITRARASLLQLLPSAPNAKQIIFNASLPIDDSSCAARLLSLRSQALKDCLDDRLQEADILLGINEHSLLQWRTVAGQEDEEYGNILALPDEGVLRATRSNESCTRTNEWLLKQLQADPYLAELYRQLVRCYFTQPQLHKIDSLDGMWQRYLIKYWFLDDAALAIVEEVYAQSTSMNSDNTIIAVDINATDDDDSGNDGPHRLDRVEDVLSKDWGMLRQPSYPPGFAMPSQVEQQATTVLEPPERTTTAATFRAMKALQAYSKDEVAR